MRSPALAFIFALIISPITHPAQADTTDSATNASATNAHSRIRLFGQNAVSLIMYKNASCIDSTKEAVQVSGGFGQALGSLFGSVSNEKIGIPETETTKNLSKHDGILSKAYYKEYEITAGKPITIQMGFQDIALRKQCGPLTNTFTPAANVDYEGHLDINTNAGTCHFVVDQVGVDGSLTPVDLTATKECEHPHEPNNFSTNLNS